MTEIQKLKRYQYIEPDEHGNTVTITMNEDQIIHTYWKFWKSKMENKYGKGNELITRENCIRDWVTVHWASEK
jgi:predicted AlkP superfamily phosphohydrolase/phosphomutase